MSSNLERAGAVLAALRDGGVRTVLASPGSRSTPLILAALELGLDLRMLVDERSAAFVALGLSRLEGPVALVCTSGSAGAHWLPALVEANATGARVLALTADRPAAAQYVGAPQTVDQTRLFGAHVRAAFALPETSSAAHCRLVALEALAVPGPAHLNLSFTEPVWASGERFAAPAPRPAPRTQPATPDVDALVAAVRRSRRGIFVAGAHLEGCEEQLVGAARRLGWPIVADAASGLRFSGLEAPLVHRTEVILAHAPKPDLVVRVGHVPTTRAVQEWLAALEAPLWLLGSALHDPSCRAEAWLPGPAGAALTSLEPGESPRADLPRWLALDRAAGEALDAATSEGLWEGVVARATLGTSAADVVVIASSMPIRDVDLFAASGRARVLVNRGANGIDGLISTAAGAALRGSGSSAPSPTPAPTTVLLGDLAFRHDLSGLLSAAELGVPLRVVVVDNGGGGIFGYLPIAAHPAFERCFLTPQHTDVAALAAAVAPVTVVTERDALFQALERPIRGLEVLVVRVDREASQRRRRDAMEAARTAAASVP